MLDPTFESIAIEEIEPEALRGIVSAWREQCDGRSFPQVRKIDPFLVPALVPNLILFEVEGEIAIFRVLGEKVVTAVGIGLKGLSVQEAFGDTPYGRAIDRQLRECRTSGVPLYSRHDFQLKSRSYGTAPHRRKAWRIMLPYGEENRVTRLLCYQLFSAQIDLPAQKDIDFETLLPKTVFLVSV